MLLIHRHIGLEGIHICADKLFPEGGGIGRLGLPDEGGNVVIHGTAPAALEVNEPGLTPANHYIPRIEIPVQEGIRGFCQQIGL